MDYAALMQGAQTTFNQAMTAGGPVLFGIVAAIAGMMFLLNRIRGLG